MTHCDTDPLVTTIIPSYNHANYISRAVESVLEQTYSNIELVITDDGSVDNTARILTQYESIPNVRILLHEKNRGQSASINDALRVAAGEFISFLPSDDWYLPQKTELQIAKFRECPESVGVVYGRGARYFESDDQLREVALPLLRGNVAHRMLSEGNFVYPATPLYRRECFERVPFDERYRAEGESIFVKLALLYDFDFVDEIVAVMRDHGYNTGKDVVLMYRENIAYWSDFFDAIEMPDDLRQLRGVRLGRIHRLKGLELIRKCGRHADGRKALLSAIACQSAFLFDPQVVAGILLSFLPSDVVARMLTLRRRQHT